MSHETSNLNQFSRGVAVRTYVGVSLLQQRDRFTLVNVRPNIDPRCLCRVVVSAVVVCVALLPFSVVAASQRGPSVGGRGCFFGREEAEEGPLLRTLQVELKQGEDGGTFETRTSKS